MPDVTPSPKPRRRWRAAAKWALFVVVALVIIDVPLSILETDLAKKGGGRPAYTIVDSRQRGAFISELAITPPVVEWKGQRIAFKEVWLERESELVQNYTIIPLLWEYGQYRIKSGYKLCVNLSEGEEAFWGVDGTFLVVEGEGASLASIGTVVKYHSFDAMPRLPVKLQLTDNWQLKGSLSLFVDKPPK
jgi:hypothetical protein